MPKLKKKVAAKKVVKKKAVKRIKKLSDKNKYRQRGRSNILKDKRRKAMQPGKRTSASGSVYYERRKNRSDKPGSLTGISGILMNNAAVMKFIKNEKKEKRAGYWLNGVLHIGGGVLAYAPVRFLKDRKIKYAATPDKKYGFIVRSNDLKKAISYLLKKDGVITY